MGKIHYMLMISLVYYISLYFLPNTNNLEINNKLNITYTTNHKYKYYTIFTNKMKTNELQDILWKKKINGWLIYTSTNNYITIFKKNEININKI